MGIRVINNNQGGRVRMLHVGLNNGGAWGGSYYLDTFPGAIAAYSLRKLSENYSGPAIRVRRDSDNAETDIGFVFSVTGQVLDEVALTAFVGSANGFIAKWYDQSGNGVDQQRTIQNQQPQIVSNGNVMKDNGRPAAYFDGTRSMRSVISVSLTSVAGEWSSFGVARVLDISINRQLLSYQGIAFFGDVPAIQIGQFLRTGALTSPPSFQTIAFNTADVNFNDVGLPYNSNQNILNSVRRITSVEIFVNGVGNGPRITTGTPNTGITPLNIGARNGIDFTNVQPFGYIQELIHYPLDANSFYLQAVEHINGFYRAY